MNENKTFLQQAEEPYDFINYKSTVLKTRIPKQLSFTPIQVTIEAIAENAQTSMMITLVVQILLRTVFSGSLIYMVSMINAL